MVGPAEEDGFELSKGKIVRARGKTQSPVMLHSCRAREGRIAAD